MMAAAATGKQKRALDRAQLGGQGAAAGKAPTAPVVGGPISSVPPTNGGNMLPAAAVGLIAVAGAAYYFNSLESSGTPIAEVPKESSIKEEASPEKPVEMLGIAEDQLVSNGDKSGNRVLSIEVPSKMKNAGVSAVSASPAKHPTGGNRVSMMPTSAPKAIDDTTVSEKALSELKDSATEQATESLIASHQSIWSDINADDLETLSQAQLRARVIQLATELKDRTKWEAVRLKEFLAMKERETAEQYTHLMQKQRLEFEDLLAKRLREQEYSLAQQMQQALLNKEASIHKVLNTALEAQKAEYEQDKNAYESVTKIEIESRLQEEYAQEMEAYKKKAAEDLKQKAATLAALTEKLNQLDLALNKSQTSQQGSVKAHRLSAAALALAEQLATGEPAGTELKALQIAAGRDGVIATAVKTIPASVANSGVATVSTLQARFEDLYATTRQAALVPLGRPGLEGQLAGMVFATLKYPPHPDDPAPDDDKDSAEFVLARARKHVQLGELERAMEQLEKLKGQAAFTIKDWKRNAMDRIAVEKALKVIMLECALLNESLA
jgi:mitofilin